MKNPTRVRETTAVRTLVKSPPELWAACSDAESLARHLGAFGEIKITRLEPESTVAWEGERASGTVTLEQSGWGTKVTMTAIAVEEEPVVGEAPVVDEPPVADEPPVVEQVEPPVVEEAAAPPPGFFARVFGRWRRERPVPEPEAEASPPPEQVSEPAAPEPDSPEPVLAEPEPPPTEQAALDAALDSLGQAHHRPFSQH